MNCGFGLWLGGVGLDCRCEIFLDLEYRSRIVLGFDYWREIAAGLVFVGIQGFSPVATGLVGVLDLRRRNRRRSGVVLGMQSSFPSGEIALRNSGCFRSKGWKFRK